MKKVLFSVALCLVMTAMLGCNGEKKVESTEEQVQVENVEKTLADSVLAQLDDMGKKVAATTSAEELKKLQNDFAESTKDLDQRIDSAMNAGKFTQKQKDKMIETYSKLTDAIEAKMQTFQAKK